LTALAGAGHELTVVTLDETVPQFEAAGHETIGVRPSRPPIDPMQVTELPAGDRPGYVFAAFMATAVDFAEVMLDTFSDRPPDLFLRDNLGWGAWLAGNRLGVPDATFSYSPAPAGIFAKRFADLFNDARRHVGLQTDDNLETLDRWLTIVGCPPRWLESEYVTATTHIVQPPPDVAVGGTLPEWIDQLATDVPTVYLTMGTVFNRTPGLLAMLIEALGGLELEVIATIGRDLSVDDLGDVPPNVHVEQFIPQALVLERCDAVICHGGYGSVMGPLRVGLPIVCVPLASLDNILNAQRVAKLGAGISITENERSAAAVRQATAAILADDRYRRAAQDVAGEIAESPPIESAVGLLEQLGVTRAPVTRSPRRG
jgi:hypothetical protein